MYLVSKMHVRYIKFTTSRVKLAPAIFLNKLRFLLADSFKHNSIRRHRRVTVHQAERRLHKIVQRLCAERLCYFIWIYFPEHFSYPHTLLFRRRRAAPLSLSSTPSRCKLNKYTSNERKYNAWMSWIIASSCNSAFFEPQYRNVHIK